MNGHKNGRISIDKITKTSRDMLVQEAQVANKYNVEHTAIYVKILRMTEDEKTQELITEPSQEDFIKEDIEIIEADDQANTEKTEFSLPESLSAITHLATIIKECPGEIHIKI